MLAESNRVEAFSDGVLAIAITLLVLDLHMRPGVTAAFFRAERLRAVAGISAAFVPVLVGLVAPLAALGFVVVMPVFYAATAEGLRSRHSASQDPPWPADEGGLELAARTWRPGPGCPA